MQTCSVRCVAKHLDIRSNLLVEMFDVETDLRQEAQKIVSIFQNEARMKRIALSLEIGESVNRIGMNAIKTDPVRLGQMYASSVVNSSDLT